HFDRRGHAHLVVITEIQACHEYLRVEIKHLVQEIRIANAVEAGTMLVRRINSFTVYKIEIVELGFLLLVEITAICDKTIDRIERGASRHLLGKAHRPFERT